MRGAKTLVNDIHSQLNPTQVDDVVPVDSAAAIRGAVARSAAEGKPLAVCGGRHAMGGQQFCAGGILLDTRRLGRVLAFDRERGTIDLEAGIEWPALVAYLERQEGGPSWAIRQKQTGADRFSLGGSVSANAHGRGLATGPLVEDVESFELVDADGVLRGSSRDEDRELFRLVVGGYGLFGVLYSVRLRLVRRRKVERVVEVRTIEGLMAAFEERIAAGFLYGDFQFATDPASEDFLRTGVFSCYRPVDDATPIPPGQRVLSLDDWRNLVYLAHADKSRAFELYAQHYLATSGQIYYSDEHQLSEYVDDYHRALDAALDAVHPGTEMITVVYVPRDRLSDFMAEAAEDFRTHGVEVIYGTIRLIEQDRETFLAWAREHFAGVIFNLHVTHSPEGMEASAAAFRRLIDMAIARGGSYFLTYHRYATRGQVERCYPQFAEFLAKKREYDPAERFQSDWYRHYRELFA